MHPVRRRRRKPRGGDVDLHFIPCSSASSALVIAILFYASQLIGTWCRELLSVAQSPAHLNTAPSHN